MSIRLNDEAMRQFRVAVLYHQGEEQKRSLDFSADGKRLLVCDHTAVSVFSTARQSLIRQVKLSRHRADAACFTHNSDRILHASTKHDVAIRCLDLRARRCVRHFFGHTKKVHYLARQPKHENVFLSAGRDHQVYIWDMRTSKRVSHLKKLRRPLCAFDPSGMTFATTDDDKIHLHDMRALGGPPRSTLVYKSNSPAKWTQLLFSPNGKSMLVNTDHSWGFTLNAADGSYQNSYAGCANEKHLPLQATFTPDSQFILSGADAGAIHIWRAKDSQPVAVLKGNNVGPVRCLLFNPQATMFVSSDSLVAFWMPKANGVYDWVDPLRNGQNNGQDHGQHEEKVEIKQEKKDDYEVYSDSEDDEDEKGTPRPEPKMPSAICMPQPQVNWENVRKKLRFKLKGPEKKIPRIRKLVDLTGDSGESDLEDGELPDNEA